MPVKLPPHTLAASDFLNAQGLSGHDLALIDALLSVGNLFEEMGRIDAATSRPSRAGACFALFEHRIAVHLYGRYMDGYRPKEEVQTHVHS